MKDHPTRLSENFEARLQASLSAQRRRRVGWIAAATLFGGFVAFAAYLAYLYQKVDIAFARADQFIPTRIYSDVIRIAPPMTRASTSRVLAALGYEPEPIEDGSTWVLQLHPPRYPLLLLPEGHPIGTDAGGKTVTLVFDGTASESALLGVSLGEHEVPEIFLEPELVATLHHGATGEDGSRQIRELVQFKDIPAPVWQAIIAVEDQHFLSHRGLDPRGIARAIWVNLRTRSLAQGGSTITQQLVKNLTARRTKNLMLKMNELFLALMLEAKYEKEQILERYLNEVYLGQVGSVEIHGVAEGAKHFFGKPLKLLNLGEIALMAGLIRGPAYYSPYRFSERANERKRWVLKKMVESEHLAQTEADAAAKEPVRLAPPQTTTNRAPYFTDFVKAELLGRLKDKMTEAEITSAGFRVYTTIDLAMNEAAQAAVARGVQSLEKRSKLEAGGRIEGALAAVDHSTGFVRALVGGKSYAESTFNRILNMKRQVGSTFKPVVYLAAIQKGRDASGIPYAPGKPMEDGPWRLVFDGGRQTWAPKNYEKGHRGWIPLRKALAYSVNTVAARLGVEVGLSEVLTAAKDLGIESPLPSVPSVTLGVAELSPVELLQAYSTLANHGTQTALSVIRAITLDDGTPVETPVPSSKGTVTPANADLMPEMLREVFVDGTATEASVRLGFDRPAAGKTGTTSHSRDAWFAGYTPQLTAVVWVGIDDPALLQKNAKLSLTGAGSALPIWIDFMSKALEDEPPAPFPLSPHLTAARIDRLTGNLAASGCPEEQTQVERFLVDLEPTTPSCAKDWPESVPETRSP